MSSEVDLGQTVSMPTAQSEEMSTDTPPPVKRSTTGDAIARAFAVVTGSSANFSNEINSLLGKRLKMASILLFAGFAAFFLKDLLLPSTREMAKNSLVWWTHLFAVSVTGMTAWRLCAGCGHFTRNLRIVEVAVFGSSALFFATLGHALISHSASQGYIVPIMPPWQILIFTYALFIPNDWRRALRVISLFAIFPVLVLSQTWWTSPVVQEVIRNNPDFHTIFLETAMVMILTSVIAVWGVATIRSLRTEVFEARKLGQYKLKRLLGKGGMGEVHLAEHTMLKRPCAIKLIRPEMAGNPENLARFEREVQSTARLTHWNTVEIFDYGHTEDGTFYYVMEYLPGMNLEQLIEMHGPMPAQRVVHLLKQTCDALGEAHEQGLVHRDIKPANIFAANRGGTYDVAKLLDFGLVRTAEQTADIKLTQEGTVAGSPIFMAPEQAQGDVPDGRSDIYSLGCVAYFLLTGETPFKGETPIKQILAHAQQTPEPLRTLNEQIPEDLEAIVLQCMEKNPANRFQSVHELRSALSECSVSRGWSRSIANTWWHDHGCPKKRELDKCIQEGLDVEEILV